MPGRSRSPVKIPPGAVRLPDGRVREPRGFRPNGMPQYFYWNPICKSCGRLKGKSQSDDCMHCRNGPRKGIKLICPSCSHPINRDEVIFAMHAVGVPYEDIGKAFGLSKRAVGHVVKKRSKKKPLENRGE